MEDIRPTAKWANRMLRPLTSIYRRLEKYQETLSIIANSKLKERVQTCDAVPARSSTATETGEGCTYSDEEPEDPAWVPGKRVKRRVRHNYSSRGESSRGGRKRSRLVLRSPELQKTLPGAIEIATPLITGKARGLLERSSAQKQLFGVDLVSPGYNNAGIMGGGRKPGRTNIRSWPAYEGSWKQALDMSGDTGFVDIAHLLDRIFIRFLNYTRLLPAAAASTRKNRGARSLLSMAMRSLPEFIAEEQREQDESAEDADVDMCDAYFTELEAHYAPHGNGWQPLREAVRAQGIYLVLEMVRMEWVPMVVACRLLDECQSHNELDAYESLLSTVLSSIDSIDYPTAFDTLNVPGHFQDPVQLLSAYYLRAPSRKSFCFDELAKLLLRRAVPPEWMVTNSWKHYIDRAIKSLSTEDDYSATATRLVEAVILSASDISPSVNAASNHTSRGEIRPIRARDTREVTTRGAGLLKDHSSCPGPIQDALNNLTLSLITALGGMHIARSKSPADEGRAVSMRVRAVVNSLALAVQHEVEMSPPACEADLPTFRHLRRGSVLLGNCLLDCGEDIPSMITPSDSVSRQNIEAFLLSLVDRQDVIKELAVMTQQVFRCYDRVHKRDQSGTSQEVRTKVSQLARLSVAGGLSTFLGKVASETAMVFAETTVDPDDHVWAVEVQEAVVSSQREQDAANPVACRQQNNNKNAGLYRWEDSIGEWVQRTPGPKLKAVPKDFTLRQVGARPSRPSTIACSTSDGSSISTASEEYVSSATSSPPSVPIKRALPQKKLSLRPRKRLRSTPVEMYEDHESDPTHGRIAPTSAHLPRWKFASTAATHRPRRGALRELTQARNLSPRIDTQGTKPNEPATNVEVVIINQKGSHDMVAGVMQDQKIGRPLGSSQPCSATSQRRQLPLRRASMFPRPIPVNETIKDFPRRRSTIYAPPPLPRTRTVIPCSQDDDSDDELSFL